MTEKEKIVHEINSISNQCSVVNKEILELCKKIDVSNNIEEKEASRIVVVELMLKRKQLILEYDKLKDSLKNGWNK